MGDQVRISAIVAVACLALAGCSVNTAVPSSGAGAAEVMTSRIVNSPTSFYISPDLATLAPKISYESYACSAWSFPTAVGAALTQTLQSTNSSAFRNVVSGGSLNQAGQGASYNVVFTLDNFESRLNALPGFWSGTMSATSEISLHVSVSDASGYQVIRTIVDGDGNADVPGTCAAGSQALSEAIGKAVKRVAENYVDKVINSGIMH